MSEVVDRLRVSVAAQVEESDHRGVEQFCSLDLPDVAAGQHRGLVHVEMLLEPHEVDQSGRRSPVLHVDGLREVELPPVNAPRSDR